MVGAVNPMAQAYLLALLGGFAVRLGLTQEHLLYVRGWTRWPLVASGAILLLLCIAVVIDQLRAARRTGEPTDPHEHVDRAPWPTWLLLTPVLVMMLISPPALGSYFAERAAESASAGPRDPERATSALRPLPEDDPVRMHVSEFFVRAKYDAGLSLSGRVVELTGFVSFDPDGNWYVTRFEIACCAADAMVMRVRVNGEAAPQRDQWVKVTGQWVPAAATPHGPPTIAASSVTPTTEPASPYE